MGQRAGQLEMEAKAIADEKYVLTRERDAVEEELRGCKVALQVTTRTTLPFKVPMQSTMATTKAFI